MHAAVEASLSAAGRGPRTELQDEEDGFPQGGWDTVFLVSLLLLGLPANGLVAWLAGSQARHGAGTRLAPLLLSLALSDFLFLAAAAFQILEVQHGGHWPLGTAACRFYYFLWGVSYSSGLFLLAALSLDRCLLALCPHWYAGRRPARLPLWVCAGVWVLATLFSVPWLIFPEAAVWWYDLVICLDFWDGEELPLRVLEVLGGFLPFLLLLTCHVLTQAKACRPCCRPRPPAAPGFARVAKTILSAYVVLRLPYQLAQLLYLAFLWDIYPGYLLWEALVYSDYLILLDSCLSPFLCLAASADLRALLRTVLASFAAALCEERPGSFTPSEPQTHGHSEALTLPGPSTGTQPRLEPVAQPPGGPPPQPRLEPVAQPPRGPPPQPRLEPVAQPPGGPPAQPRLEPVAQPPGDPPAQPRLEPVAQPPGGPPPQPRLGPVAQPPLDPVAQPHVEPVAQPHVDSEVQPQSNTEAQTSGPIAASAPSPDDKATPTPSSDPTPGAPENPAMPTTPEGESLGDAPPDKAPGPGPT
ncbi:probable G-protein coupled receptor 152 [Lepus europaeus]|uniref:probable G-protein coupled receptor 152 n=1 Tax=Lepus europaeus TaxID=9983 RepID=UPI002B47121F|nr:probable G-protein coupled receptor 152 [Lepus europaeus]